MTDGPPVFPPASESRRPLPVKSPWSRRHWESGSSGALEVQWCADCETWSFPPGPRCRACWSPHLEFRTVAGTGALLTWTHNVQPWQSDPAAPYHVALVELDEGVRLLTNLLGADGRELRVGARIRLSFHDIGDDVWLPQSILLGERDDD